MERMLRVTFATDMHNMIMDSLYNIKGGTMASGIPREISV